MAATEENLISLCSVGFVLEVDGLDLRGLVMSFWRPRERLAQFVWTVGRGLVPPERSDDSDEYDEVVVASL